MKMLLSTLMATVLLSTLVFAGEPVNKTCPFSGNPVDAEVSIDVGEDTVAFCCGGCLKGFKKWEESRQLTYIAEQKASQSKPAEKKVELLVKTPYLLDICPISGKKLGSMGDVIVEIIDGREVRFCCESCPPKFKENKKELFAKLDKLMIAQQLPYYPTKICVVSGKTLDFHGGVVDFIYGNRLFRTCCHDCKAELIDNPVDAILELDEEILKAQKSAYPLDYCIIGRGPLDGMGGPDHMIVGNRLVELCCAGCRPKVLKNPLKAFAEIDKARK